MNDSSTVFESFRLPTNSLALNAKSSAFDSSMGKTSKRQRYHRIYDDITTNDDDDDISSDEDDVDDLLRQKRFPAPNRNNNISTGATSLPLYKERNCYTQNPSADKEIYVLDRGRMPTAMLQKSHSYNCSDSTYPKATTILKQNSADGRVAASLSESYYNNNKPYIDDREAQVAPGGQRATVIYENPTLLALSGSFNGVPAQQVAYASINVAHVKGSISDSSVSSKDALHSKINITNDLSSTNASDDEFSQLDDASEQKTLLLGNSGDGSKKSRRNPQRHSSSTVGGGYNGAKPRASVCFRSNALSQRNWYLTCLVSVSVLVALAFFFYWTRDYTKHLLFWVETQNPWVIFVIFILLFIVVSFPIVVGYFLLMIAAGYLLGVFKGLATVILGANLGIAIAHVTIKSLRHRIPLHKLIKTETGRAILRVISGPRAFKVVLFTRLTPIPFGLQNVIFGVSSINQRIYHMATLLGLLPAQTLNVYLGSTLRSIHDVFNSHSTAITGYISFGVEVICGASLMVWVIRKARKELSETLLSNRSTEGKLIDIQV